MLTEPVQRAKTSPDGLERTPTGGIKVRLPLKPEPDDAWAACFVQPFSEHFTTSSIRGYGLTIVGGAVEYVTSETNFDAALSDVDRRIAGCNKWYFGDYTRRATQEQLAHEERGREAQAEQQRIGDKFGGK